MPKRKRPKAAAEASLEARLIDVVQAIGRVIDLADPERPEFADSNADVVQALWHCSDDVRAVVREVAVRRFVAEERGVVRGRR